VLPFLFISGLVGLLFRELIFTISAAIVASLVVAVTLVPRSPRAAARRALARDADGAGAFVAGAQRIYLPGGGTLKAPWLVVARRPLSCSAASPCNSRSSPASRRSCRPWTTAACRCRWSPTRARSLDEMDRTVQLERLAHAQGDVDGVSVIAGGSIFGRSAARAPEPQHAEHRAVPVSARAMSIEPG
jgi:hypothetical protein